jgi:multiple sugar transport system ATP-binding protein
MNAESSAPRAASRLLPGSNPAVVAGFRPEDCWITPPSEGKIAATVYSTELMGDHTLVTCSCGPVKLTVKADKSSQHRINEPIGISFADGGTFLFDKASGARIR